MSPDDRQAGVGQPITPAERHDISWLAERRSVAVKRLGPPAPSEGELEQILRSALAAADHGALRPWRIVICTPQSRERLADLFVAAKVAINPSATDLELSREREKALRPPILMAVVAAPRPSVSIPEIEQVASAGAALQSVLFAAHGLGYGAIMLSGSRCAADNVRSALGVKSGETILGFISIGSIVDTPRLASRPNLADVVQTFDGSER
jgi:nitroreductase